VGCRQERGRKAEKGDDEMRIINVTKISCPNEKTDTAIKAKTDGGAGGKRKSGKDARPERLSLENIKGEGRVRKIHNAGNQRRQPRGLPKKT